MNFERLGNCSSCRAEVVLAEDGVNGFRLCTGCARCGPDVVLESEAGVNMDMEMELVLDDMTVVEGPPAALVERSRWRI